MRYEYQFFTLTVHRTTEGIEQLNNALSTLGRQGWRIIGEATTSVDVYHVYYRCTFERPFDTPEQPH